jgi:O-antigen/teichoic acid export membrane protein
MAINETAQPTATLVDKRDSYFQTDHLKVDLGGRTARGGAVTIVTQGLKFLIGIIGTMILARLLTPQDYGLIGMVAVIIGFVSIFKDLGLSSATIQRAEINTVQISTLFWINVALSIAVMLVCVAIAPLVAMFYHESRLLMITLAYGFGFLLGGLAVQHEALLRRQMRFTALAGAEVAALIASVATAVILAWKGAGYWALVMSQLSLGAVYLIAMWTLCSWRPGWPSRNAGVRSMLVFGGNLTGFSIINFFARNVDNLLIGKIWGSQQLGLYAKAYQLLLLPIDQVNSPITAVAVPALSRLADDPERYRQAYMRIVQKVAIITMPGVALMIGTSDWIVRVVLGPQWMDAAWIFSVLGIAGLIQPIANTTGWLFVTQGRTNDMFRIGMIGGPITIAAIIIGLPWGARGVATSYVIAQICLTNVLFWFVGRRGPVRTQDLYRTIGPFAAASVSAVFACLAFRYWRGEMNPVVGIMICLMITVVTAVSVLWLLPTGRSAVRDALRSLVLLKRQPRD